jgi:hypothetical protein
MKIEQRIMYPIEINPQEYPIRTRRVRIVSDGSTLKTRPCNESKMFFRML